MIDVSSIRMSIEGDVIDFDEVDNKTISVDMESAPDFIILHLVDKEGIKSIHYTRRDIVDEMVMIPVPETPRYLDDNIPNFPMWSRSVTYAPGTFVRYLCDDGIMRCYKNVSTSYGESLANMCRYPDCSPGIWQEVVM